MEFLILGLVLFLGVHSLRIFADARRQLWLEQWGDKRFKVIYSLVSVLGFVLLCWGFAQSKLNPIVVWSPPVGLRHLASLLVLVAFVLVVAAYVPNNHLKVRLGHPMYAGVKLWALAHLLSNGLLAEIVLFGAFLVWSVLGFPAGRRRDRLAEMPKAEPHLRATLITLALGLALYGLFAAVLHVKFFGVSPFGA